MSSSAAESVKVAVRCRPLNGKEREAGHVSIVQMVKGRGEVLLSRPEADGQEPPRTFTFDYVFPPDCTQRQVFDEAVKSIVDSVLQGYNGTVFAYGQTGTGKTFTMEGDVDREELRGVMPNTFFHIMDAVQSAAKNVEFLVRMSFLEIYQEQVYDLLHPKSAREKLDLKENAAEGFFFVVGLTEVPVKCPEDMLKVLKVGQSQRRVGATAMNEGSSRSHCIMTIIVETSERVDEQNVVYRTGKLNLVDLAGSERQKKTGATGERLQEAKHINQSLSALGNVINALVTRKGVVPYRDSKLTRLLKDSLGGNTKTVMIANLGPAEYNYDETMNTLRYANRAKNIQNKPKVNEDPKDTMLRQYQEEISRLRAILEAKQKGLPLTPEMLASLRTEAAAHTGAAPVLHAEIEEQLVEKLVEVDTGIREEDLHQMEEKAKEEQARLKERLEKERSALLEEKQAVEETARVYQEELRRKEEEEKKQKADLAQIERLLAEKEEQLLQGKQELEKAAKIKAELKRAEEELKLRREQEERLRENIAKAEEEQLYMTETYSSKQEELDKKTKKLKLLYSKFQQKRLILEDLKEAWDGERLALLEDVRELQQLLKLKELLLDCFVPSKYVDVIESRSLYEAHTDTWLVPGLDLAFNNRMLGLTGGGGGGMGVSGRGFHRREPMLMAYARQAGAATHGPSSKFDPTRQTGMDMAPEMQAALEAAMASHLRTGPRRDVFETYPEPQPEDRPARRKTGRR